MKKHKQIIFILSFTFVCVVAWICSNIYHIYVTSTIAPDLALQITPIDPTFDLSVIEALRNRAKVIPVYDLPNKDTSHASSSAVLMPSKSS